MRLDDLRVVDEFAQLSRDWRYANSHDGVACFRRGEQVAHGANSTYAGSGPRHLIVGMALGEFLETAHLGHVEFRIRHVPQIVELNRDPGVSLDAADGFDGDALHPTLLIRTSLSDCHWASCLRAGQ